MRALGEHWEPSGLLNRPLPGRKKCCMAFCIFHMIAAITKLGGTSHNVTWGFTVERQRCHIFMKRCSRGPPKDALESVSTLDVGPHIFRRVRWHPMAQLVEIYFFLTSLLLRKNTLHIPSLCQELVQPSFFLALMLGQKVSHCANQNPFGNMMKELKQVKFALCYCIFSCDMESQFPFCTLAKQVTSETTNT